MSRARGVAASLALALVSSQATAQTKPADDAFLQGKALLDQGKVDDACDKLAESLALERRGGTLLNLGMCRQRQGRHASAVRLLFEASARARTDGREDRVTLAEKALAESRAKLSWLRVRVPSDAAPGLAIQRDGEDVPRTSWGVLQAVDPGAHVVTATAPERQRFEVTVEVGGPGEEKAVDVPPLAGISRREPASVAATPASSPPAAAPTSVAPTSRVPWELPVGWTATALGAISLGVGAGFGVKTILDVNASNALCPHDRCVTVAAYNQNVSAHGTANVADATLVVGTVLAAAGIYLLVGPARAKATAARLAALPTFSLSPSRAAVRGVF